ncbi:MAG TPA: ABC transporter permease [Legionella sp.]|nr:ABC transporter permease [Legionella sp.]
MYIGDYFQQACINSTAAKLRSFLAILGILMGTASVVALLSCGQLATEQALTVFKTLGTDLLAINMDQSNTLQHQTQDEMNVRRWHQLARQVTGIKNIAPFASTFQEVSYRGHVLDGVIIGADETLAEILHISMAKGYFVSFVDSIEHYCVIGEGMAQQIRKTSLDDPLGQQIQIGPHIYTIIGIAAHWTENAFFNYDVNQAVITPLNGMGLISADAAMNNAIISLQPDVSIDKVVSQVKGVLTQIAPKKTVFIRSAKQMIASMESQGRIFTLLLAVIGGISLFVGGIGVMNVMLVSVTERKKEIGIRKAVGAKARDIQSLFLMESVLLGLSGGILGVVCGALLTCVIAHVNDWPFHFYFTPPLAGFGVSVAAGVFFGYYPAKRAAHFEPIVSLRGE